MIFYLSKKKFNEISNEFIKFIENKRLIIHNADFDLLHLNNELKILGKKPIENQVVDTLALARDKFPGSQVSLDALCKRYRIDNSRRIKHTALVDCDLLAKVYVNLIDQKEPMLDFENNEKDLIDKNNLSNDYYKKVIKPNSKELESHAKYLQDKLKKNYFN